MYRQNIKFIFDYYITVIVFEETVHCIGIHSSPVFVYIPFSIPYSCYSE